MTILACPTDIVAASAERIWKLLTEPTELVAWTRTRLVDGPARALVAGDRLVVSPGFGTRVISNVRTMEPLRQLAMNVEFPLGIVIHEVIQISQIGTAGCRVTFN